MDAKRATIIVLDSVGVGASPDADQYGDEQASTLTHIAEAVQGLELPNLGRWGLGNIVAFPGTPPADRPEAAYGKMEERSVGKDTMVGHWELAGLVTTEPLSLWPEGFSEEIVNHLKRISGREILANRTASGTVIIEELGAEHMETGALILYTSADSVIQIAAHEDVVKLEELYRICEEMHPIAEQLRIGRIIARPFVGKPGEFQRTYNRRDYPMKPPGRTVLDWAKDKGVQVVGVGKIEDIYAGQGITEAIHTEGNADGVKVTLEVLKRDPSNPMLVMNNLVDFDMLYGHRNNPRGYAQALIDFDARLPELEGAMGPDELMIITADHGNDPTTPGTDHTREHVPLLVKATGKAGKGFNGRDLGLRDGFIDVAATLARVLNLGTWPVGRSFL